MALNRELRREQATLLCWHDLIGPWRLAGAVSKVSGACCARFFTMRFNATRVPVVTIQVKGDLNSQSSADGSIVVKFPARSALKGSVNFSGWTRKGYAS